MRTAKQLRLTQNQLDALIKTRDLLASRIIQHDEHDIATKGEDEPRLPGQPDHPLFNMSVAVQSYECGSICCIGGNMKLIEMGVNLQGSSIKLTNEETGQADSFVMSYKPYTLGDPRSRARKHNPGLTALFFPREIGTMDAHNLNSIGDWEPITPAAAVDAINNYLETGKPDWEAVGRKHGLQINHTYLELKREAGL